MQKFLDKVAGEILKSPDFYNKTIVLPNKRAGIFLKKALIEKKRQAILSPQIHTIESFLAQWAPYQPADRLVLLFEFFETYKSVYGDKAQKFDEFIHWAPTVLQDFNEIDSFNVDAKAVFHYINEVKKIEDWQLKPENPKIITDYLKFYSSLYDLYTDFQTRLTSKNIAYQGMINRYVAGHIDELSQQIETGQIIFAGFNALNATEEKIIKYLVNQQKAEIFWDADRYYLDADKSYFEAGQFLQKHQKDFKDFKWIFDHFSSPKKIDIIGVPGSTTQAQAIAQILAQKKPDDGQWQETAIVLNEDDLLLPVINSLPDTVPNVNITLGLPLKHLQITQMFEWLVKLYQEKEQYGRFNFDTILNIIKQGQFEHILTPEENEANRELVKKMSRFKSKLINQDVWWQTIEDSGSVIKRLLIPDFTVDRLLQLFLDWIDFLSGKALNDMDKLALVKLEKLFKSLQDFVQKTGEINNMRTFSYLFNQLLHQERLAFEGEPLQGLQIMGILETRLLDYKNVIITSMNEGVIPQGKNDRSIIPFELKKHFGLPMHRQNNAVIAYHFYRLLQRAENITLMYNIANDGFGAGEPSRFISQVENELDPEIHQITHQILGLSTSLQPVDLEMVKKTDFAIAQLEAIARKGFSPSALTTYIRNPLRYYQRYILKLKEPEEASDSLPANVIGNIIHKVMESLYKNHTGRILQANDFDDFFKQYPSLALRYFIEETFGGGTPVDKKMIKGKNLIVFEIVKRNIQDLIRLDQALVKQGHSLEIVSLEQELRARLPVSRREVYIKGHIDRIDRLDGRLRIIDYKTGKVEPKNIQTAKNAEDLSGLLQDETTEKLFQLLTYAWLFYKHSALLTTDFPLTAGILSTRHIKQGLLVAKVTGQQDIDVSVIKDFENQLIRLVEELFNPDIPFVEKDSAY